MQHIELYDTTLRDGNQAEGISFSIEDKIIIAQELDNIGISYIEGGYPGSNKKDIDFFNIAKKIGLKQAKIVPFGSTRRTSQLPENDQNLLALLQTELDTVTIFGKSWHLHVTDVLGISLEDNLKLIEDSVAFLTKNEREVFFDAEHFFDGYRANKDYALMTLKAAVNGGASSLVLCDTNGGTLPLQIKQIVEHTKKCFPNIPLGIHVHNDSGMAVANSIIAVESGISHIQGTFNGYGERCGNADLCSIIPNLKLKLNIDCITDNQLKELTRVSRLISELANLSHNERQPYVGKSAFAHKGGMHIDAVEKNPKTFEHIEPKSVGNEQRILISDQSGRSAIVKKLESEYPTLDKKSPKVKKIFEQLKQSEKEGYQYEGAEASFELLAQKALKDYGNFFDLLGFRVIVEKFENGNIHSEATIKIQEPNGEKEHTASDGEGPVNALDRALRKALEKFYPELSKVHLTDYKVRVLETKAGTGAKVRVLIESSDGEEVWGTVGVSEDIIEASWQALADSIEYKLFKEHQKINKN